MYTLLNTAKLNGLDPESYLSNVLSTIADHPLTRIDELLPWNVSLATAADDSSTIDMKVNAGVTNDDSSAN